MSNPLYYLFALLIGLSYPTGSEPLRFARPEARFVAPLAVAAALLLIAAVSSTVYRIVLRRHVGPRARMGIGVALKAGVLGLYSLLVGGFHWPLFVWEKLRLEDIPLIGDFMILAPAFLMLGIHAAFQLRAEAEWREAESPRALYSFAWRTFLAFSFLPVLLLLLIEASFQHIAPLQKAAFVHPSVSWAFVVGMVGLFMTLAPAALRFAFRCRPLEPGARRDRLEALARSAGFGFSNLLRVETGGARIANAFIVGLFPAMRYVFFTDRLLGGMNDEELECVMSHEMVHALRRHILCYLLFSIAFLALASFLNQTLESHGMGRMLLTGIALLSALVFWVFLFGFASRRFESEADIVGARLAAKGDSADVPDKLRRLASTLYRVCELNHIPPEAGSWRHWSVAKRALLMLEAEADPLRGARLERVCSTLRAGCVFFFLAGLSWAGLEARHQAKEAPRRRAQWAAIEQADKGARLLGKGRASEAIRILTDALARGANYAHYRILLAQAYESLGDRESARNEMEQARRLRSLDPRERLLLEEAGVQEQSPRSSRASGGPIVGAFRRFRIPDFGFRPAEIRNRKSEICEESGISCQELET